MTVRQWCSLALASTSALLAALLAFLEPNSGHAEFCARQVLPREVTDQIWNIRRLPDGLLLVTFKGLFRYAGDRIVAWETDTGVKIGARTAIVETGDQTLLAIWRDHVFRRDGDRLIELGASQKFLIRGVMLDDARKAWIFTDQGAFRVQGRELIRVSTRPVTSFHRDVDGDELVGTSNGLFRLADDTLVAVGSDAAIGAVAAFHSVGGKTLLVEAEHGLFRRVGDRLIAIEGGNFSREADDWLTALVDPGFANDGSAPARGETTFLQTRRTMFRLRGDVLEPLASIDADLNCRGVARNGDPICLAGDGLVRFETDHFVDIADGGAFGFFNYVYRARNGDDLLVGGAGLFRLSGAELVRIDDHASAFIYEADDGTQFVSTKDADLYRREGDRLVPALDRAQFGRAVQTNPFWSAKDHTLFFRGTKGFFRRVRDSFALVRGGENVRFAYVVFEQGDGEILVGTGGAGLFSLRACR